MQTSCNECGATLEVAPDTRFIVCHSCTTPLRIERKGDTIFTSKNTQAKPPAPPKKKMLIDLEELKIPTGNESDDDNSPKDKNSEIDRIERSIARLDREWQNKLPTYRQHGGAMPTDDKVLGALSVFTAVISIILIAGFLLAGKPDIAFYCAGGLLWALVFAGWSAYNARYHNAKKAYEEKRKKLLQELRKWEK